MYVLAGCSQPNLRLNCWLLSAFHLRVSGRHSDLPANPGPLAAAEEFLLPRPSNDNEECTVKHNTKLLPQAGISCFFLRSW